MTIKIVPKTDPTPAQAVIERVKVFRVDGHWQCNSCGSRTVLRTECGAMTREGRKIPGTVIDNDVCASCWKHGIHSPMRPELKAIE